MEKTYDTKGRHVLVDMWGIDTFLLENQSYIHTLCKLAVAKARATFVDMVYKKFEPHGLTMLFLLEESHLSIHNYSEFGYSSIDCYCCGDADPNVAIDYIIKQLKPTKVIRREVTRGVQ